MIAFISVKYVFINNIFFYMQEGINSEDSSFKLKLPRIDVFNPRGPKNLLQINYLKYRHDSKPVWSGQLHDGSGMMRTEKPWYQICKLIYIQMGWFINERLLKCGLLQTFTIEEFNLWFFLTVKSSCFKTSTCDR